MAKFDHLAHDKATETGLEFLEYEGDQYVNTNMKNACWHCLEETTWVSISFGAYLCSEECANAKWKEYFDSFMN